MDELFPGIQFLGFVAFPDRGSEIAFAVERHTKCQLRVKMCRLTGQQRMQLFNSLVELPLAEVEHCRVVLILEFHNRTRRITYRLARVQACAVGRPPAVLRVMHGVKYAWRRR